MLPLSKTIGKVLEVAGEIIDASVGIGIGDDWCIRDIFELDVDVFRPIKSSQLLSISKMGSRQ